MESLGEIEVDLGGEPQPPDGLGGRRLDRAPARIEGTPRADFLAELVAAQPAIVVGGAHGKTTTAAMIAFVLQETGARPGLDHRRHRPAARRQRRRRHRAGSSSRATSPTARSVALRPQIAVVTNIELDHHATYASEAELRVVLRRLARRRAARRAQLGADAGRARARRARRRTTARTPPRRSRRSSSPASPRAEAEAALVRFTGVGRRLRARRRARRRHRLRRLRPQPDRARGDAAHGARALTAGS